LSRAVVVCVVSHRMGGRHPAKQAAHFAILSGAENQVPVIRHELIRMQLHVVAIQAFGQDTLEGRKITVLVEHDSARITAIQDVVKTAGFIGTFWSWHRRILSNAPPLIKQRVLTPFSILFLSAFSPKTIFHTVTGTQYTI